MSLSIWYDKYKDGGQWYSHGCTDTEIEFFYSKYFDDAPDTPPSGFSTLRANTIMSDDIQGNWGCPQVVKLGPSDYTDGPGGDESKLYYGGILQTNEAFPVAQGDTLYLRLFIYIPSSFCGGYADYGDGDGTAELFSFSIGNSRYTLCIGDLQSDACASDITLWGVKLANVGNHTGSHEFQQKAIIPRDKWVACNLVVNFNPYDVLNLDEPNGWIRGFLKDEFLGQVNLSTMPANFDDGVTELELGGRWYGGKSNGGGQDSFFYMQDVALTTDEPTKYENETYPHISRFYSSRAHAIEQKQKALKQEAYEKDHRKKTFNAKYLTEYYLENRLKKSQVLVIYDSNSPEATEVADYYKTQRGLDDEQLLGFNYSGHPNYSSTDEGLDKQIAFDLCGLTLDYTERHVDTYAFNAILLIGDFVHVIQEYNGSVINPVNYSPTNFWQKIFSCLREAMHRVKEYWYDEDYTVNYFEGGDRSQGGQSGNNQQLTMDNHYLAKFMKIFGQETDFLEEVNPDDPTQQYYPHVWYTALTNGQVQPPELYMWAPRLAAQNDFDNGCYYVTQIPLGIGGMYPPTTQGKSDAVANAKTIIDNTISAETGEHWTDRGDVILQQGSNDGGSNFGVISAHFIADHFTMWGDIPANVWYNDLTYETILTGNQASVGYILDNHVSSYPDNEPPDFDLWEGANQAGWASKFPNPVFLHYMGSAAYWGKNELPMDSDWIEYVPGAIALFGRSYGGGWVEPSFAVDLYGVNTPNDRSTQTALTPNWYSIYYDNYNGKSMSTVRITRRTTDSAASATATISAGHLILSDDIYGDDYIDIDLSNLTPIAALQLINSTCDAAASGLWHAEFQDSRTVSRSWIAMQNGAVFSYGPTQEPLAPNMAKLAYMLPMLSCGATIADWAKAYRFSNYGTRENHFYGDPLYTPFPNGNDKNSTELTPNYVNGQIIATINGPHYYFKDTVYVVVNHGHFRVVGDTVWKKRGYISETDDIEIMAIPFLGDTDVTVGFKHYFIKGTKMAYRKLFAFLAEQTSHGGDDEIGVGHLSLTDPASDVAFGKFITQPLFLNFRFNGFSMALSPINANPTVEAYLGFDYNLGVSQDHSSAYSILGNTFVGKITGVNLYSPGHEAMEKIWNGSATPLASFDFSTATDVQDGSLRKLELQDCGVADPTTIMTDGEPYWLELVFADDFFDHTLNNKEGDFVGLSGVMKPPMIDTRDTISTPNIATMFNNRGNDVSVNITHRGNAVRINQFTRFTLDATGAATVNLDTDVGGQENTVLAGENRGDLVINAGAFFTTAGDYDITVKGYNAFYPNGINLIDPNVEKAALKVTVYDI